MTAKSMLVQETIQTMKERRKCRSNIAQTQHRL
jgi:hypothetical protein